VSFQTITACRSCGNEGLFDVLDLGEQPLANGFRRPDDTGTEQRYPLALVGCRSCSLVQLSGTVPPSLLFDEYHYFSSFSDTMVEEMRKLAARTTAEIGLDAASLVVEVASNDGYLLKHYQELGVGVLGIEPAQNVAAAAIEAGVPTLVEYFGEETANLVVRSRGQAAVIHANNVMAHVPNINDFVKGLKTALAPDGVCIVESPYLVDYIEKCEFDTTYHEHVFYYSLTALDALVRRHGLVVSDVEKLEIHGGTLRCSLRHDNSIVSSAVQETLSKEAKLGVGSPGYYAEFAARVSRIKRSLVDVLEELKQQGATIVGYGAAAKGTVLLNHFGIDRRLLDYVVDRSPHKQGLLVPGVELPILDPEQLLNDNPSHVLLLAWNFADEVLAQQSAFRKRGGHFIIPIPELRIV
jgi:SAM-dependent methyltransferase